MTKRTRTQKGTRTRRLISSKLLLFILLATTVTVFYMPTKVNAEITSKLGGSSLDVTNGRVILIEEKSEIELAKPLTAKDAVFDNSGNIYIYLRNNTLKVGTKDKIVILEKEVKNLVVTGSGETSRLTGYVTKDSITKPALTVAEVKTLIETGNKPTTNSSNISIEGMKVVYTENGISYTVSTNKPVDSYGKTADNIDVIRFTDGSISYLPYAIQKELGKTIALIELDKNSKQLLFDKNDKVVGYYTTSGSIKPVPTIAEIKAALTAPSVTPTPSSNISIEGTKVVYKAENGISYTISTNKSVDNYGKTADNIDVIRFTDGSISYLPYAIQKELGKTIELIELDKNSKQLLFDKNDKVVGYYTTSGSIKPVPTIAEIKAALTAPSETPKPVTTPSTVTPKPVETPSSVPTPNPATSKPTSTKSKSVYAYKLVPKGKKMILKNSKKQTVDEFIKKGKNKIVYKGWKIEGVMLEYVQFNKAGNLVVPYRVGKCEVINHKNGKKKTIMKKGLIKIKYDDDGFSKTAVSKKGNYTVYKK